MALRLRGNGPINLHFLDVTRVAGETMTGHVDLNVAQAQNDNVERLSIKFKGIVRCRISTSTGAGGVTHHSDTIILCDEQISLWDRGSAFPPPGSHILSCPFQFTIPETAPPSFHCEGYYRKATISYALEVVGQRPGRFKENRNVRQPITVLAAASQAQLLLTQSLRQGWSGAYKTWTTDGKLKEGLWGKHSHVRVMLDIPDLTSYPNATAIPFRLHVETDTKPLPMSDAPVDKHGNPFFPAPPASSSHVRLRLHRTVDIRVRPIHSGHVDDDFLLKGSLGDSVRLAAVSQVTDEPEWIPSTGPKDKKGLGIWRRAVHFSTTVTIPYTPTVQTDILNWRYFLRFTIPFPMLGDDIRLDVPLQLHSSLACPPPSIGVAGSSDMAYADVIPAGPPPPPIDLPPSYSTGEHHVWDGDEKN
ncbi:arrestin-N domain-containing protein [Favolaschia claudopus]|uniref:Arrestin-N domain-containing protein n=1 Tax=Favolaschia claudopus TaxID=2862362 RepID=A0AAW0DY54_9AGAR